MTNKIILYLLAAAGVSPLAQFIFKFGMYSPHHNDIPFFYTIIFLCGPVLVVTGLLLVRQKRIHMLTGSAAIILGLVWIFMLARDVVEEAMIF